MWTRTTRKQHIRETYRYQTDVTDEEWRVIEPTQPPQDCARSGRRATSCQHASAQTIR